VSRGHQLQRPRKFKVRALDLAFRSGLNYVNIGELLGQIERLSADDSPANVNAH